MKELFNELRDASLFYWKDKRVSGPAIVALIAANGTLMVLARSVFHGWGRPIVSVIASLLGFLILAMGCVGALLRPGSRMPDDAYKLGRVIAIVWLLTLVIISPGVLPPLRAWLGDIPPWNLAIIVSLIASALFALHSITQAENKGLKKRSLIVPALFVCAITCLFFESIVIDENTDEFLNNSKEKIGQLFNRH